MVDNHRLEDEISLLQVKVTLLDLENTMHKEKISILELGVHKLKNDIAASVLRNADLQVSLTGLTEQV